MAETNAQKRKRKRSALPSQLAERQRQAEVRQRSQQVIDQANKQRRVATEPQTRAAQNQKRTQQRRTQLANPSLSAAGAAATAGALTAKPIYETSKALVGRGRYELEKRRKAKAPPKAKITKPVQAVGGRSVSRATADKLGTDLSTTREQITKQNVRTKSRAADRAHRRATAQDKVRAQVRGSYGTSGQRLSNKEADILRKAQEAKNANASSQIKQPTGQSGAKVTQGVQPSNTRTPSGTNVTSNQTFTSNTKTAPQQIKTPPVKDPGTGRFAQRQSLPTYGVEEVKPQEIRGRDVGYKKPLTPGKGGNTGVTTGRGGDPKPTGKQAKVTTNTSRGIGGYQSATNTSATSGLNKAVGEQLNKTSKSADTVIKAGQRIEDRLQSGGQSSAGAAQQKAASGKVSQLQADLDRMKAAAGDNPSSGQKRAIARKQRALDAARTAETRAAGKGQAGGAQQTANRQARAQTATGRAANAADDAARAAPPAPRDAAAKGRQAARGYMQQMYNRLPEGLRSRFTPPGGGAAQSAVPGAQGKPSVVRRTAGALGRQAAGFGKLLAKGGAPIALGTTAIRTATDDTETLRDRFGRANPYQESRADVGAGYSSDEGYRSFDKNNDGEVGLMDALTDSRFWSDIGTRTLGAAGNLANTVSFGLVPTDLGMGPEQTPAQTEQQTAPPPAAPAAAPQTVDQIIDNPQATAAVVEPNPVSAAIATQAPGANQIGTTGFRRGITGPPGPNDGYRASDGQGSFMASRTPGAAGGGTVNVVDNSRYMDSLRNANAIRAEAINNQRARDANYVANKRARFGDVQQGGRDLFGRTASERLAAKPPEIDPRLTRAQNRLRQDQWREQLKQARIDEGVSPITGRPWDATGSGGSGGIDFGDQIAAANLRRNFAKDARQAQMDTIKYQNEQLNNIDSLIADPNPIKQLQGWQNAVQAFNQDPMGAGGQKLDQMIGSGLATAINNERGAYDDSKAFFMGLMGEGGYGGQNPSIDPAQIDSWIDQVEVDSTWHSGGRMSLGDKKYGRYFYRKDNPGLYAAIEARINAGG